MQLSQLPAKIVLPFGDSADADHIRAIPVASQPTTSTDAPASFTDGFPPATFLQEGAGGIPPNGKDFNGILNVLSAWVRWQSGGGAVLFDSGYAASVGGYPKGARLMSSVNPALTWVSSTDGNTTDPDSSSASGWVAESDVGHSYNANGGYLTFGPIIFNFGRVALPDNSGHVTVTYAKAFKNVCLSHGASNYCGNGYPSSWAGTGNETLTTLNVGMSVGGSPGGAGLPAGAGTFASWWAWGL